MGVLETSVIPLDRGENQRIKKELAHSASLWGNITRTQKCVRTVNLNDRTITQGHIIASQKDGRTVNIGIETKDAYKMVCSLDTELLAETPEHTLIYLKAGDAKAGTVLMCNGTPDERYKDADWLKRVYVDEHRQQSEIAQMCGVAERTIRAYVKKFNLNRGDSGALFGEANPNHKSDEDLARNGGYARSYAEYQRLGLVTGVCALCGAKGKTQIHHIDHDPTNTDPSNFIELCEMCHKSIHLGYAVKHVRRSIVASVWDAGQEDTVSFKTDGGNLVIEGFIVKCD